MFSLFNKRKSQQKATYPIFFKNTFSGEKEVFKPIREGEAKLYGCGPTVYDYTHLGNLRAYILPSLINRVLTYNGYKVAQVMNVTDFGHLSDDADAGEDKMTKGLRREGMEITLENMLKLGERYTEASLEDMYAINIVKGSFKLTRASGYIREQIAINKTLEEKGYAYRTGDGLYFDSSKFREYGKLGKVDLDGLREGARIEMKEKRNPTDFALWKKDASFGWDSPWGKGFPGWHIECTAMIFAELGKEIDIHTGGVDLIPIHHNNEIAQAEAVSGKKFVHYWVHNAHVTIENQKAAKSLGNTIRLSQVVERGYNPLTYRYWILTGHYSTPMNFTWTALDGAQQALTRLHKFFVEELGRNNGTVDSVYKEKFTLAVNDDLDTPKAIALLWELIKDDTVSKEDKRATILDFDRVLGIGFTEGVKKLREMLSVNIVSQSDLPHDIKKLLDEREAARSEKDFAKADELRDLITSKGYTVEDAKGGAKITKKL